MKYVRLYLMMLIVLMIFVASCGDEDRRRRSKSNPDAGQLDDVGDNPDPVCGNGILEAGELCDPEITSGPGVCPETCDDGDVCTAGRLEGDATSCTAHCVFDPVSVCQDGDGCCPAGCTPDDDSDCVAGCGDGVLDPGELCDPGIESGEGSCPASCTHADSCMNGTRQGHPSTCSAVCVFDEITQCRDNDGCCPEGCTAENDNDCGGGCVPLTCAQAGVQCGATDNGCGEPMNCPACPGGQVCVTGQCQEAGTCLSTAQVRVEGTSTYSSGTLSTQPLETVEFRGEISTGVIGRYEWSIITRPDGFAQQLTPNSTAQNPTLWLEHAGTYEVELVLYDEDDLPCAPSVVTINAASENAIHIQLTWTIPAIPNPGNGNGTDLDLYYLHPTGNGVWDQAPWSVYWANRQADWGTSTASLDIDDLWGSGLENVNHRNPEAGLSYALGVHYYQDNGHGPSDAKVRIYINGELRQELDKHLANTDDFWQVGLISWPSGDVTAVGTVTEGYP